MLEALWSVEFESNLGRLGTGVAVFETGRILGGDAHYLYVGSYDNEHGKTKANVRVTLYAGPPNSIFGSLKEYHLILEGEAKHDVFDLRGHLKEEPNRKIKVELTRRAELP